MSSPNPLPTSLYEGLLPKLVTVLELTQKPEGTVTPQAKQALLQAVGSSCHQDQSQQADDPYNQTNEFKNAMNQAKDLALALPGGELLIEEQDEIIEMLERLRDRKRQQLLQFSAQALSSTSASMTDTKMEIDSMASTPFHD